MLSQNIAVLKRKKSDTIYEDMSAILILSFFQNKETDIIFQLYELAMGVVGSLRKKA